jgi:hypothetical protein
VKEMIYYPSFEVKNKNWLKFAMLYFDSLRPIIPYTVASETEYLSEDFRRIMYDTDLILPYRPEYDEGNHASILACEEFEKYLSNPERYKAYFGRYYADKLLEKWRTPAFQDCILFEGKYSNIFFAYCIENDIATPCREGISICEDLAFAYMSLLADVISRRNELEMITDNTQYSSLLLRNNMFISKSTQNNLKIAENNLEICIPGNLSDIPISEIIHLRSQRNFNDLRKAYVSEIRKLIEYKESVRLDYSMEELLSYKKDFIKICEKSLNMLAVATLNIFSFSALDNGIVTPAIASVFVDCKVVKDAISEAPQFIEELRTKHLARKYLAKIGELNKVYRPRG